MRGSRFATRVAISALSGCVSCALLVGVEDDKQLGTVATDASSFDAGVDATIDSSLVDAAEPVASEQNGPIGLAVDATYVYWANERSGTIWRRAKSFATPPELVAKDQPEPQHLLVDGTALYWNNANSPRVEDGGAPALVTLLASVTIAGAMPQVPTDLDDAADLSKVVALTLFTTSNDDYIFSAENDNHVRRYHRSTKKNDDVGPPATVSAPIAVAVDETYVYWFDQETHAVWRRVKTFVGAAPAPETMPTTLSPGLTVNALTVDDQSLYLFATTGDIERVSKTASFADAGSPTTTFAKIGADPRAIAMNAASLVVARWTTGADGQILVVKKADGSSVTIADGQNDPRDVAVDDAFVYWTTYGDGTVRRAPLP